MSELERRTRFNEKRDPRNSRECRWFCGGSGCRQLAITSNEYLKEERGNTIEQLPAREIDIEESGGIDFMFANALSTIWVVHTHFPYGSRASPSFIAETADRPGCGDRHNVLKGRHEDSFNHI